MTPNSPGSAPAVFVQSAVSTGPGLPLAMAETHPQAPRGQYHHGDLPQALKKLALELIAKHGVEGFSLRQAATALGVAPSAVYRHFADKSELLSALAHDGFQAMGAYRMGQLAGDQLAHVQGTYMYRLSQGGMFQQGTYVGTVLEAGDAWGNGDAKRARYSTTAFLAVDSKIGDIYLGAAKGTGNVYNLFVQLGRRFSF